ncbi:MAG: hypothetical protein ACI8W7_000276 [Gammaproteobacteria bacterium]
MANTGSGDAAADILQIKEGLTDRRRVRVAARGVNCSHPSITRFKQIITPLSAGCYGFGVIHRFGSGCLVKVAQNKRAALLRQTRRREGRFEH